MSNEEKLNIAIVSDSCDNFVLAQSLYDQIIDSMRFISVQVASQIRGRGLRGHYEYRNFDGLFRELRLVNVDVGAICDEIKIVFLR